MNGERTWKFNDLEQWVQILSSDPEDITVELTTLIANFNPQYYPEAKMVGYHWNKEGTFTYSLSEVIPAPSSLQTIDKNLVISNVWNIQIGTYNGTHSAVIFNPNGKIYQEDNKTSWKTGAAWSIDDSQSLFLMFQDKNVMNTCFISTVIANNNPVAKNDITLMGGQLPLPEKDSYVPHTCVLTLAKIQKFRITQKYILSKSWYAHIGGENGTQTWMVLNPNGKIYDHINETEEFSQSKWTFN